jgi:hypothetical protein
MTIVRRGNFVRRNDRCPCGSNKKFKRCCATNATVTVANNPGVKPVHYIDTGESAARYVICDSTGVKFFSDKDGRILVFSTRDEATAIALLEDFVGQDPGDINVASVGQTKWEHLQATLPFIEVKSVEHAVELIRERIEIQRAKLESFTDELDTPDYEEGSNDVSGTGAGSDSVGNEAQDHPQQQPDGAVNENNVGTGGAG